MSQVHTMDEKVVLSIEFNKENFEKNIKSSIAALNDLVTKLNHLGDTKSLDHMTYAANELSNMSLDRITKSVASLERRFSAFGIVGMTVITNITNKMMTLFHRITGFATDKVIQGGIRRAMNLENADFQLMGLLKSSKKVQAVMKNVNDAVDGTAYSLDAAANVASQLAASGMKAGKNMEKSLRAVAGVAAMTNSEYSDIGRIFTSVAGNGRIMTDQLVQLSSRGLNAAASMAKYYNSSTELQKKFYERYNATKKKTDEEIKKGSKATERAIRTMVKNGAIDFQTFANAMDYAFGEHAKDANDTFTGALSNIGSALARIGAEFVQPVIKSKGPMVKFLNTIRVKINELKAALTPVLRMAADMTNTLIKKLTKQVEKIDLKGLTKRFSVFTSRWDTLKAKIAETGATTKQFKTALIAAGKKYDLDITQMIKKEGSLKTVIDKGLISRKVYNKALKLLGKELKSTGKSAGGSIKSLKDYKKVVNDVIRGVYGNGEARVKALTKAGYNYKKVQSAVNKVLRGGVLSKKDLKSLEKSGHLTKSQAKALKDLKAAAKSSKKDVDGVFKSINKRNPRMNYIDSVKNSFKALKTIIKTFKNAYRSIFDKRTSKDAIALSETIRQFTEKLILSKETAKKLKRTLAGLFAVVDTAKILLERLVNALLPRISKRVGDLISNVLDLTAKMGDNLVAFRDWVEEGDHIVPIFTKLKTRIQQTVSAVKNFVTQSGKIEKIKDAYAKLITKANAYYDIVKSKYPTLSNIVLRVRDSVSELYHRAMQYPGVAAAVDKVKEVFGTLFETVKTGFTVIKDRFNTFIKHVKELDGISLDNLKAALKFFKEDVLNNFGDLSKIASKLPENFIDGFVKGLSEKFEKVKNLVVKFFTGIIDKIREILGIHSPSTVMKEIGLNIMEGLKLGLLDGSVGIFDAIRSIIANLINEFSNISFGQIATIGVIVADLIFINRIIKLLELLAKKTDNLSNLNPFSGLNSFFANLNANVTLVAKTFSNKLQAETLEIKVNAFATLIKAFAMLAGALTILSYSNVDNIKVASICIGALLALMAGVFIGLSKVKDPADFKNGTKMILSMIGVLIGTAVALKIISTIVSENDKWWISVAVLSGMIVAMYGLLILMAKHAESFKSIPNLKGAQRALRSLGVTMILMAAALKIVATIDGSDVGKCLLFLITMGAIFAAFVKLSQKAAIGQIRAGAGFVGFAIAASILANAIKIIADVPRSSLKKAMMVIGETAIVFAGFLWLSRFAGRNAGKAGLMFIGMALALLALTKLIERFENLKESSLRKAMSFIRRMSVVLIGLMAVSSLAGEFSGRAGKMFARFGSGVLAMAVAVKIIGSMKQKELDKAMTALVGMGAICIAMVTVSSLAGQYSSDAGTMLLKMAGAIIIIAGAVALLTMLKPKDMQLATFCIETLIGSFALLIAATANMKRANKTIYALAASIAILGGIVFMLGTMDPGRALVGVASLDLVLLALAKLMKSSSNVVTSWKTVLSLTLVIGALAGALYILKSIPADQMLASGAAMSILLNSLSKTFKVIKQMAYSPKAVMQNIGLMALTLAAIGGVCFILQKLNVEPTIEQAISLSILAVSMSIALKALATAGVVAVGVLKGIAVLIAAVTMIAGFAWAVGKVTAKHKDLDDFASKGLDVLVKIGYKIGEFFGAMLRGGIDGAKLPKIGSSLTEFMGTIQPFLDSLKGVDKSVVTSAKNVAEAMFKLTEANFLDNLNSALFGENSMQNFAKGVSMLGDGMKSFLEVANTFSDSDVEQIKIVAKAARELTKIEPPNQQWYSNSKDTYLANFSGQLEALAEGVVAFANATSEFKSSKNMRAAIHAINDLTEIQPPNQQLWSTNDDTYLTNFSTQLPELASGLANFINNLPEGHYSKSVKTAVKCLSAISEIEPPHEPILKFLGGSSMDKFSETLPKLGVGLSAFAVAVSGIQDKTAIDNAVGAINSLSTIEPQGQGLIAWFNNGTLGQLSKHLGSLGEGIAAFYTAVQGIETTENMATYISVLQTIADIDLDAVSSAMVDFSRNGQRLNMIGVTNLISALNKLCTLSNKASATDFSGIKKLKSAADTISNITVKDDGSSKNLTRKMSEITKGLFNGLDGKAGDAEKSGKKLANALKGGIDKISGSDIAKSGTELTTNFTKGIEKNVDKAKQSGKKLSLSVNAGSKSEYMTFGQSGTYLAGGLAAGMNNASALSKAYQAGVKLAKEAERGEREYSRTHSPSRLFMKLGNYLATGLAIGMDDGGREVFNAGNTLAKNAESGLNSAIRTLSMTIEDGVDTQPVIKPVLDLSDVKENAGLIDNMFTANKLTVSSVGAANVLMNRNQNDSGSDIISAIRELGASLNGGDTYNINGVTYDDGSAINGAVATIVRAAKIERRV